MSKPRLAERIAAAPLLLGLCDAGLACGPFFPNRILLETDDAFLALPFASADYEFNRVPSPYPPPFPAILPPGADQGSRGVAEIQHTEQADVEELKAALDAAKTDPAQRQPLLDAYVAVRAALTTHAKTVAAWKDDAWTGYVQTQEPASLTAAPSVPEGLPAEFADYLRGAIAYHMNQPEQARQAWTALLQRPPAARHYRSIWAAYMLGRSLQDSDPAAAANWYHRVGELAKEGYADSLGLASAGMGWEARTELQQKHYARALEQFRVQLEAGEPSASISLLLTARHTVAEAGPEARAECVRNPTARRLVTAYILASSMSHENPNIPLWLESFKAVDAPVEEAERLAWSAYTAGRMDLARAWLEKAPKGAPIAEWLRAKLLLREGKVDAALPVIAEVAAHFPRDQGFAISNDDPDVPEIFDATRARAEIGGLRLARREYVAALDALMQRPGDSISLVGETEHGRYWEDAAYIAEQVLTIEELKHFVDARWPTAPASRPDREPQDGGTGLRALLARRLARLNRLDEAAPYYPASEQDHFRHYAEALRQGRNAKNPAPQRAAGLWIAAQLARNEGLGLLATETDPDWASLGAQYDLGDATAARPSKGLLQAGPDERTRAKRQRARPYRRFHYRYLAAELAWDAAKLMPDQSNDTARVLATAGTWLKGLDAKAADRFYKALVKRCGDTDLGRRAKDRHWFPELPAEGAGEAAGT